MTRTATNRPDRDSDYMPIELGIGVERTRSGKVYLYSFLDSRLGHRIAGPYTGIAKALAAFDETHAESNAAVSYEQRGEYRRIARRMSRLATRGYESIVETVMYEGGTDWGRRALDENARDCTGLLGLTDAEREELGR